MMSKKRSVWWSESHSASVLIFPVSSLIGIFFVIISCVEFSFWIANGIVIDCIPSEYWKKSLRKLSENLEKLSHRRLLILAAVLIESNSEASSAANSTSFRAEASDCQASSRWSSDSVFEWTAGAYCRLRSSSAQQRSVAVEAGADATDAASTFDDSGWESKSSRRSMTHRNTTRPSTLCHPETKADGLVLEKGAWEWQKAKRNRRKMMNSRNGAIASEKNFN